VGGGVVRPPKIVYFLSFTRDGILGHQTNKRLESLLHANHSAFCWRILKKAILFYDKKNPYKKIHETRKLESVHEKHFVERKMRVENQPKTRVYAQKPRLKMPFKNSISGQKKNLLKF
jgi:hypothetical protein